MPRSDDLAAQPLADRRDVARAAQRVRLERARRAIAKAALGRRAVVDRGVFPERAHLVDDRDAEPATRAQRRQRVQHRRMRVEDVGVEALAPAPRCAARVARISAQIADARHARRRALAERRAMKAPTVDVLDLAARLAVARRRELQRLPAERPLLAQDGQRAEHVAAVQRKRVIEDVQDAHGGAYAAIRPRRRVGLVHDLAQEGVEHQQRPQRRAVVAASRLVVLDEVLEIPPLEIAGRGEPFAEQRVAHALPQRPAEPARERHRESHLRPIQDLRRQVRLHRLLEQVLALLPADLERRRQRRQPFDERMIHQRLAHFERVRHARAVDLGVDVADEVGLEVEILDQRQRIVRLRLRGVMPEHVQRFVAAEARLERVAEELRAHRIAQDRHRVEVGLDRVARERLERRLRAQHARRPVELRIRAPEQAEQRAGACPSASTRACALPSGAAGSGDSRRSSRRRRRPTAPPSRACARAGRRDRSGSPSCRRRARRTASRACRSRSKSSDSTRSTRWFVR